MSRPGEEAEALAAAHLGRCGLAIVARNYRCRFGEIDIVAQDRGTLVFVEVRLRSRSDFGTAAESINGAKRKRLIAAARHYLARTRADCACRFDAFLVGGDGRVEWLKNVISE
jgi:putative endonuclease